LQENAGATQHTFPAALLQPEAARQAVLGWLKTHGDPAYLHDAADKDLLLPFISVADMIGNETPNVGATTGIFLDSDCDGLIAPSEMRRELYSLRDILGTAGEADRHHHLQIMERLLEGLAGSPLPVRYLEPHFYSLTGPDRMALLGAVAVIGIEGISDLRAGTVALPVRTLSGKEAPVDLLVEPRSSQPTDQQVFDLFNALIGSWMEVTFETAHERLDRRLKRSPALQAYLGVG